MAYITKDEEERHDKKINVKGTYPNLFQVITVLEDINAFEETESYKKFVKDNLGNIIDKCKCEDGEDIKEKYFQYLEKTIIIEVKHLLTFLKKYELMDFYTYYFPGRIYSSQKDNLTEEDIIKCYKKELSYISKLDKEKMEKDFLSEKQYLSNYNYLRFQFGNCIREAILNYISNKSRLFNDLYLFIEPKRLKYVKNLLESYQINYEVNQYIKCDDYILTIYLSKGKELETIHKLLDAYHGELQRFYHYGSSKEKLEEDKNNFINNNQKWLERKKER